MKEENVEAKIQFVNFVVNESHIVFNEPGKHKITIKFTPKGLVLKELSQFQLNLGVNILDEGHKFNINLETTSIFKYPEDANLQEYIDGYFILNAPAIVFPYLRAYISSLTVLSGMPALILPTLNLSSLGEELRDAIQVVD
ncbi:protein-export chaperone SecB [Dyadobacter arcticus]|uniref:Preprotein translocase subunit SecB n=1 Tax=Dyadobacter arcticus TaxID=1078754 RepID=A0ABX0UIJ5_9BACT|nr:protein-export chaperone SecB [Dyadobacter arcticus]NIJ52333.1 preprotein translocase subunit SecB [Dyadobacter arcticus]